MGRTDKEIYRVIDNVNSYYRINSESKKELLLNKYPNAAAAYSLRLLDGYYRGPLVRVRRDDGVEVDVYPDYNNQLSLDSLVTNVPDAEDTTTNPDIDADYTFQLSLSSLGEFVSNPNYVDGGTAIDATVCVWYDQSSTDGVPNDNDASQSVALNQPLIVSSGVIVTENGKPAASYDGVNDNVAKALSITQPVSVICVYSSSTTGYVWSQPTNTHPSLYRGSTYSLNGENSAISVVNGQQINTYVDGSNGEFYVNGTGTTSLNTLSRTYQGIGWGSRKPDGTPSDFLQSLWQEIIVYDSDQSTNRTGIEEDINSFYQIDGYTPTQPLLDEFSGAAAAYSLRLLSSTYNGPLVRIRRTIDNTEVDVYPDSDGEFSIYSTIQDGGTELTTGVTGGSTDKTTLHEFLYGQDTDCMVVRWYDQASGNHATQDVATDQPKIYDSVTGVVTRNGKPFVMFSTDLGGLPHFQTNHSFTTSVNDEIMISTVYEATTDREHLFEFNNIGMTANYLASEIMDFNGANCRLLAKPTQGTALSHVLMFADGTDIKGRANGAAYATDASDPISGETSGVTTSTTQVEIGRIGNGFCNESYIAELVLYPSYSAIETGIESNINQHYNIY